MADMKYTAKDSVFSFIFRQPENTRHLYLTLHPEDVDVTEADCKLVTLEHILTNGMTNDLGFQVRDKLILLVEAQSKFSINIALRMLLYLAAIASLCERSASRPKLAVMRGGTRSATTNSGSEV